MGRKLTKTEREEMMAKEIAAAIGQLLEKMEQAAANGLLVHVAVGGMYHTVAGLRVYRPGKKHHKIIMDRDWPRPTK